MGVPAEPMEVHEETVISAFSNFSCYKKSVPKLGNEFNYQVLLFNI